MGLFESKPAPSASGAQDDRNDVDDGGAQDDRNDVADGGAQDGFGASGAQDDRNDVADGGAQDGFGCDLAGKRFASATRQREVPPPPSTRRRYLPGLDVDGAFTDAAARGNALTAVALAGAAPGAAKRRPRCRWRLPRDAARAAVLCATDRVWGADAGDDGAVAAAAAAALARYGGAKATVAVRAQPWRSEARRRRCRWARPWTRRPTTPRSTSSSPRPSARGSASSREKTSGSRARSPTPTAASGRRRCAAHKLSEVLAFGLDGGALAALAADPGGCVVDVGAAPGGWTSTLAAAGVAVLAVDPAALNAGVAALANVTHARKKVEDLTDADYPAGAVPKGLVCDVNAHPAQLVETIAPLVRSLPRGAPVVLTLKFGGKGHEAASEARKLTHAAEVLADLGDVAPFSPDFRLEWLVSNTKRERTLIAFRA
ncbi:FtsJ-like methyltransferase [Aureococcus anophagefferens]|uniref:FtsJ-like methyltransferase n=1 Tax=Aureococcus anophagefferens TaxID=44056 RepID=A0ABR1FN45_AURAN